MTQLRVRSNSKYESVAPTTLGALPLPSDDAATTWSSVFVKNYFNQTPSQLATSSPPNQSSDELLFDARAQFKIRTSTIAVSHFDLKDRTQLFKQLDSLFDPDGWEASDKIPSEASFTTLLRLVLFLGGRRPSLGATEQGNFIAAWNHDGNRLTVECQPNDNLRWAMIQSSEGVQESTAGKTVSLRLPEFLAPYEAPRYWFPNAFNKATT